MNNEEILEIVRDGNTAMNMLRFPDSTEDTVDGTDQLMECWSKLVPVLLDKIGEKEEDLKAEVLRRYYARRSLTMLQVPERSATVEKVTEILTNYRDRDDVALVWGRAGTLEHDGQTFRKIPQEEGLHVAPGRHDQVYVTWIEPEDMRGAQFEAEVDNSRKVMLGVYGRILQEAGYVVDRRFTPNISVSIGGTR